MEIQYPTDQHAAGARAITDFFRGFDEVSAVLLTCSCARNKATKDSCLDIAILIEPSRQSRLADLGSAWRDFYSKEPVFQDLKRAGKYSHVDLDIVTGDFDPARYVHDWTTGPDAFELEIGNIVNYSRPLYENGNYFRSLRRKWLPYYSEDLRKERLELVLSFCTNNLDHIPIYAGRKLYFQAFERLYMAYKEFLQALFISKRRYPIAYDKWISEQIRDILILPDLYSKLVRLISVENIESDQIIDREKSLRGFISEYISM
jgi:hypothetical protein